MPRFLSLALLGWPLAWPMIAGAVRQPMSGGMDEQIAYVDYAVDEVTLIRVRRGTVTRIVLAADEHILADGAATGYAADCSKPEQAWCIRADQGGNQIVVRPKADATDNNMELRTDKRDYSFRFDATAPVTMPRGARQHADGPPLLRVMFRYPSSAPAVQTTEAVAQPDAAQIVRAAQPMPRNWRYTMQALPGADDITPALAFDDGRFTYFQFAANREMPTVYVVSAAGEEARVNFHIDQHDPGLVVVERLGRRFVLRLGAATVGIWNEAFDAEGVRPAGNTSVDGVVREWR